MINDIKRAISKNQKREAEDQAERTISRIDRDLKRSIGDLDRYLKRYGEIIPSNDPLYRHLYEIKPDLKELGSRVSLINRCYMGLGFIGGSMPQTNEGRDYIIGNLISLGLSREEAEERLLEIELKEEEPEEEPEEPDILMTTRLFYDSLGSPKICRRWHNNIEIGKFSPESSSFTIRKIDNLIAKIDLILGDLS